MVGFAITLPILFAKNVQLIVIDDEINRRSGFHYEKEFETYIAFTLSKNKN